MSTATTAELAEVWRYFVEHETRGYSPLYTAIVEAMLDDHEVLALVLEAPATSHHPLLLLAAVHDLALAGELPELAAIYRGEAPPDAAPALFRAAVLDRRPHVLDVLATRFVQTNETGRAAAIALGLAAAADRAVREPAALVDAGTSAGLNLLYDRYRLDLGDVVLGDPRSEVVCGCRVSGPPPGPPRLVDVPVRVGIDRAPVDVTDPVRSRWLLACTWPDTDRLARTRAALALAATTPPDIRAGDLVDDLPGLVTSLDADGPVCVLSSFAVGYLDLDGRRAFTAALAGAARERPVWWLSLENVGVVRATQPLEPAPRSIGIPSVLGLTVFTDGVVDARPLAHVHPHGRALVWIS